MALPAIGAIATGSFWTLFVGNIVVVIIRILRTFGIGIITYLGVSAILDVVQNQIQSMLTGNIPIVAQILDVCQLDQSLSIIFGTLTYVASCKVGGAGAPKKHLEVLC